MSVEVADFVRAYCVGSDTPTRAGMCAIAAFDPRFRGGRGSAGPSRWNRTDFAGQESVLDAQGAQPKTTKIGSAAYILPLPLPLHLVGTIRMPIRGFLASTLAPLRSVGRSDRGERCTGEGAHGLTKSSVRA